MCSRAEEGRAHRDSAGANTHLIFALLCYSSGFFGWVGARERERGDSWQLGWRAWPREGKIAGKTIGMENGIIDSERGGGVVIRAVCCSGGIFMKVMRLRGGVPFFSLLERDDL